MNPKPSSPAWPLLVLAAVVGAFTTPEVLAQSPTGRQAYPLPSAPAAKRAEQPAPPAAGAEAAAPSPRVSIPTTGLVTIESDLQRADNKTGVITATGNVRIVYPDQQVVATARQAQYFSLEGRVILSGDVDIIQTDGHAMRAERVIYDVNTERLLAVPPTGKQVFSKVRLPAPQGSAAKTAAPTKPKPLLPPAAGSAP